MKTKEIIVCLVTLIVLAFTVTNVFATELDFNELINGTNTANTTNTTENEFEEIQNATDNNLVENNAVNTNNAVNNENVVNDTDLPETGLDNSIVIIIAICGISALYAYKKIKDYNIK